MNSPKNESLIKREKETSLGINQELKGDKQFNHQVETFIKDQYGVFVPALIFEYRPSKQSNKDFSGWDYDDLLEFFSHFGEVDLLEIYGKKAIILFKSFLDAHSTREFLENSNNFKDAEKENFYVRWYSKEDEFYISDLMRSKFSRAPFQMVDGIGSGLGNNKSNYGLLNNGINLNYYNNYNGYNGVNNNSSTGEYYNSNLNGQYNYYAQMTLTPKGREELNGVMNKSQQQITGNYSNYQDENKNQDKSFQNGGKLTCKFDIQIQNDNEFQVARRLIGAKVICILFLGVQYEKNCRIMFRCC
jgi:hypothetical protein